MRTTNSASYAKAISPNAPESLKPINIKQQSKGKGKTVKDVMTKDPEYISPKTSIRNAANEMQRINSGSLPVGDGDKLLGFITDRDITIRAVAKGLDPDTTNVEQIMTKGVLYCYADTAIKAAADNMRENNISRLVVLDENKSFVGVLTHSKLSKVALKDDDKDLFTKSVELSCYRKAS